MWQVTFHPGAEQNLGKLPPRKRAAIVNAVEKLRMKLSDMKTADDVLREQLEDATFREEWERTVLARAVAIQVIAYRAEHGLSQAGLARELSVSQPLVARLERGEHEPTFATLTHLSRRLGLEFHIDITPAAIELTG